MITLGDVAKKAGVSSSTVSIVVNNRQVPGVSVSAATRERVLQVARQMGYTPNSLARAMATGKNRVFAIVKEELVSEIGSRILNGAQQESARANYLVKPFQLNEPDAALELVQSCLSQRVAGMILVNLPDAVVDVFCREAQLASVPVVMVDDLPRNRAGLQITSDNRGGVRQMCEFLLKAGHREIGFIGGPEESWVSQERKRYFRETLAEHGLSVPDEFVADACWARHDIVEPAVARMLDPAREKRPTALFCAGDAIAMMAIRAARKLGYALPWDLSVTGFMNATYSYLSDPSLTTVGQDFEEMARIGVRYLEGCAAGQMPPLSDEIVRVPTKLVVRESVAGVRGQA